MYSGIQIEPANTSNWRVADESWPTVGSKPGFGKVFLGQGKMVENQIVEDPNRLHNI